MHARAIVDRVRAAGFALAVSVLLCMLVTAGPAAAASASLLDPPAGPGGPAPGASHGAPAGLTVRQRPATARLDVLVRPDGSSAVGVGDRVSLDLFDDASFSMILTDVARQAGGHTWSGTLDGVDLGYAVLAAHDGALVGHVSTPGAVFRIGYAPDGTQVVEEIDPAALPREAPPLIPGPAGADAMTLGGESPDAAADTAAQIDVMVVYTAAARTSAGGTAAMLAEVSLAVATANQAYANNGLVQRLRLVFSVEVSITETGNFDTDLNNLRANATVGWLRDATRADIVSLLTSHGSGSPFCGVGFLMQVNAAAFAPNAFNMVERSCASSNLTFPHELGHNMGAHHDPYVAGSDPTVFPYSHGFVDLVGHFRTIMAYPDQCNDAGVLCPRIQFFSTPNLTNNGRVIGNAGTSDNSRTLGETANVVANFRQALVSPLALSTGVNQPSFAVGETLVASVGLGNPGMAGTADIYLGLMLPNGTAFFFTDVAVTPSSGFAFGDVRSFPSYRPIATGVPLGSPFNASFPNFISYQRAAGDPSGGLVWFLLVVTAGALQDGVLSPGEVIGASLTPFTFPSAGGGTGCANPIDCKGT